MNYITTCTHCETQFFLSNAQLSAYKGKAKCGHCEKVFDAKKYLIEVSEDIHSTEEYQASLEKTAAKVAQAQPDFSAPTFTIYETEPSLSTQNFAVQGQAAQNLAAPNTEALIIEDYSAQPRFQAAEKKPLDFSLIFLCVLFLLAAALQTLYFKRNELAALYPETKPYFVQGCQLLQCDIEFPKKLDMLTIDDSDMQENSDFKGAFNFTSRLVNHSNTRLAYPNIELTLTDANDVAILRRKLKPSEYLPQGVAEDAGFEAGQELFVKFSFSSADVVAAGYRLQLAY